MDDSSIATVVKSGEICIRTTLSRARDGLAVTIWTHPRVEDFIRSLGTGEQHDVQTLGRHWVPLGDPTQRLMVYSLTKDLGRQIISDQFSYSLGDPGYPLVSERQHDDGVLRPRGSSMEHLNLSFLRLVGSSEGSGVTFVVKGVFSATGKDRLGERIGESTTHLYRNFLKPFKLIVTVSTMPID